MEEDYHAFLAFGLAAMTTCSQLISLLMLFYSERVGKWALCFRLCIGIAQNILLTVLYFTRVKLDGLASPGIFTSFELYAFQLSVYLALCTRVWCAWVWLNKFVFCGSSVKALPVHPHNPAGLRAILNVISFAKRARVRCASFWIGIFLA